MGVPKAQRCRFCFKFDSCKNKRKDFDFYCKYRFVLLLTKQIPPRLKRKAIDQADLVILHNHGHPFFKNKGNSVPISKQNPPTNHNHIEDDNGIIEMPTEETSLSTKVRSLQSRFDQEEVIEVSTREYKRTTAVDYLPLVEDIIEQAHLQVKSGKLGAVYPLKAALEAGNLVSKDYDETRTPEETANILLKELINPIQKESLKIFVDLLIKYLAGGAFRDRLSTEDKASFDHNIQKMVDELKERIRISQSDNYKKSIAVSKRIL